MLMTTSSLISQSVIIPVESSYKPKIGLLQYSSSNFSIRRDRTLFLGEKTLISTRRVRKNDKVFRNVAVYGAIQPGLPPPSEPSFQLLNWVVGVLTMLLPIFTHKLSSLLRIKKEVETAVETIEEIVEVVEKVAEGVETVAEDIADHMPEGGSLRKAVDFVENVAETVGKDAHLVEELIHKVQEAEEKVEECVESLVEEAREHRKQEHRAHENLQQTRDQDVLQKI
ncbi:uncharacterized protein [Primulina eburnea]|uniref:uncharacterized protein isoform X2 n=1 Tax=Primulina eburnea TaxID=1245227 RepID=UPI003C6C9A3B